MAGGGETDEENNDFGLRITLVALCFLIVVGWRHEALQHPTVLSAIIGLALVVVYVLIASRCRRSKEAAAVAEQADEGKATPEAAVSDKFDPRVSFTPDPVFSRAEMKSEALTGSVKRYDSHVFVVGGNPSTWPARIKSPVVSRFEEAKQRSVRPLRITACFPFFTHGTMKKLEADNAVLMFPERVGYRTVDPTSADRVVDEHINDQRLVNTARARDVRCGACGPQLLKQFKAVLEKTVYRNQVNLYGCSHVGGHKFAGNVITFGRRGESGQTLGVWYGYVTPDRCADILEALVRRNEPVMDLWRGQMGMDPAEHQARVEQGQGDAAVACATSGTSAGATAAGATAAATATATASDDGLRRRARASVGDSQHGGAGCGAGCACVGDAK